jgi:hypothetical protein
MTSKYKISKKIDVRDIDGKLTRLSAKKDAQEDIYLHTYKELSYRLYPHEALLMVPGTLE